MTEMSFAALFCVLGVGSPSAIGRTAHQKASKLVFDVAHFEVLCVRSEQTSLKKVSTCYFSRSFGRYPSNLSGYQVSVVQLSV
jgi:hypothetical protein